MREVYKPEGETAEETEQEKKEEVEIIDRWDQFKTYYFKPMLIVIAALICVGWMFYDMVLSTEIILYSGASIGCVVSDEGMTMLSDNFKQELGKTKKREKVLFTDDVYMSFTEEDAYNNQAVDSAMFAFLATGEFNYLILDESVVKQYFSMSAFYDVTELAASAGIDSSLLKKNNDGDVVAIALPEEVCKRFGIEPRSKKAYIAFVPVKKTGENDPAFLRYLFSGVE